MSDQVSPVAAEIDRQIGVGAFVMMGTRLRVADGDDLVFDIRGCQQFNRVRVHLTDRDTYEISFVKLVGENIVREEKASGVYGDTLHRAIEEHTGLSLIVPRVVGVNA